MFLNISSFMYKVLNPKVSMLCLSMRTIAKFLSKVIEEDWCLYISLDPQVQLETIAFATITFKHFWKFNNAILHDTWPLNANQMEESCWKIKYNLAKKASWERGKALMDVLDWNYDEGILDLWHNNYKCAIALVAKMLTIQKVYVVSNNFLGHHI